MRIEPVPGVAMSQAPAVQDYLAGRGPVMARFPFNPHTQAGFVARQRYLAERWQGDRQALADALVAYNQRIGAGPDALAAAARLAEPGALAVVTGQQAGAATGPLYTLFKAITAVQLARQQEERLGVPVVPVFWVAAEDHDFAEIATVQVPAGDGWARITLGGAPGRRISVGHIPVGPAVEAFLAELEQALPPSEFRPAVMAWIREAAAGAANLADWFARAMAALFRGSGLCFISPTDPAVRRLQAPCFAALIEQHEAVDQALAQGMAAWQAAGYEPTVVRHPGDLNLFLYVDGERLPLAGAGAYAWVRDRPDLGWSRDELLALAHSEPERFSANVVTRGLSQGFVLPDLAYVAGPGEIQYFGLYAEVFRTLGRELPVIYPRTSVTLVEPSLARYLEKQGLQVAGVFAGLEERRREVVRQADPIGLEALFAGFRAGLQRDYDRLVATLAGLDPSLRFVAAENWRHMARQVDRLEEKAWQAVRRRSDVTLRQLDRLEAHLYPQGKLQERVANISYFLAKYGLDLVARLLAALPLPQPWVHLAVFLG